TSLEASFCLLHTAEDFVKFPRFGVPKTCNASSGKGISLKIRGIICTKSLSLPCSQRRLMAFYVLIDVDSPDTPHQMPCADWGFQSIKSLEKKINKAKFSAANFALQNVTNSDSQIENQIAVVRIAHVQKSFNVIAYVCLTFPEPAMTQDQLYDFLALIQIADVAVNCPKYFRAFDQYKKGCLTFIDFILGCAALEMHTTHGNEAGEQRCRYIFRYYCKKHDFTISFGEFVTMIDDILTFKMTKETKGALEVQRAQLSRYHLSKNQEAYVPWPNASLEIFTSKVCAPFWLSKILRLVYCTTSHLHSHQAGVSLLPYDPLPPPMFSIGINTQEQYAAWANSLGVKETEDRASGQIWQISQTKSSLATKKGAEALKTKLATKPKSRTAQASANL
uniref:EF-hand domain-containing protein n=1 Tax=Romanomermis culicivorax TaxID=13658 RepID=A0A915J369_ROMCU